MHRLLMRGLATVALLLGVLLSSIAQAQIPVVESPAAIQMLGHVRVSSPPLGLDAQESQWLAQHPILTVGILPNDLVPFDILGLSNEYEGVSADYLHVVAAMLRLKLEVKVFRSAAEAARALAAGEIDLLPTLPGTAREGMALSAPYFPVRYVEVAAPNRELTRNGEINVGYVPGHVSADPLRKAYPRARLVPYGSVFLGLTAVLGGKVDVFVENGTSAAYLIDQYQLSGLHPTHFSEEPASDFHFALRSGDTMRQRLIDKALAAVPLRTRNDIRMRWSPTFEAAETADRVQLSAHERQWIAAHPVVRYATVEDRVPFMFADSSGNFRGLSVDVLETIASRTGLVLQPAPYRYADTPGQNSSASIDILPVVTRGAPSGAGMKVSDVYFQGYWVIVSRTSGRDYLHVEDLAGKRIAYLAPNGVVERIKERVPSVQLVPVGSFAASYEQVATGKADVTLGNINTASYFIQKDYAGQLKVAGAIGDAPVDIAFGVRDDAPELLGIINKALESIPPSEMRRMRANWMFLNNPGPIDWRRYYPWMYAIGFGVLACIALFAIWNRSLQKQVRRRLAAEHELRKQLAFQTAMLDGIPHAIAVRDRQTHLIHCNTAFERFFGVTQAQLIGATLMEGTDSLPGMSRETAERVQHRYERVLAESKPLNEDIDLVVDGQTHKIFHWAAPISQEANGAPVAVISGLIDVQERYHLLDLVEAARAKAEAANRAKSNFLATMSHEIRTPMNAVMGALELLAREGRLASQDQESVLFARTSASALLGLIDDILDISKIEAGGLEIMMRPTRLRPIIEEAARVFKGMAAQRGLHIHMEIDPDLSEWHAIDAVRFRQIVNNLVSNAIKYTDTGGVWLRLRSLGEADDVETVELEVQDSGIGIAPEDVQNLFKPFFQAEAAGPRTVGGTGLGLPIVQRLCNKMGGDISVESQRGAGTTVRVSFPLVKLPAPQVQEEAVPVHPVVSAAELQQRRQARSRFRILVVDDHPANRMLLERQLAHLGYGSAMAENGKVALDLLREEKFDLVITDCSMPVMDGYALTTAIRQDESRRQPPHHCPVLGCTAHVQEGDRRRALDIGMDECLIKPIGIDALLDALQRHLPDDADDPASSLAPLTGEMPLVQADGSPAFNPLALQGFSGGNAKIEAEFLATLQRSNQSDLAELENFARRGAFHDAAACAHKIKGAARIIQAEEVAQGCEAIENAAEAQDAQMLVQRLHRLTQAIGRLHQAFSVHLHDHPAS